MSPPSRPTMRFPMLSASLLFLASASATVTDEAFAALQARMTEMESAKASMERRLTSRIETAEKMKKQAARKLEAVAKLSAPLAPVPSAGYTRAGPGAGMVHEKAQPAHHARLLASIGKRRKLADAYDSDLMPGFSSETHQMDADSGDIDLSTMLLNVDTSIDHTWILVAGLLCWFLQGGFALLEAGAVRAKNAKNIALKNTMDACVGGVVYYLFGYALAYGSPGDGTGNMFAGGELTYAFMLREESEDTSFMEYYGFFFQYVFAATIATIVSGAVAERITFKAYMLYSIILTGIIYPICSHWIWSGDGFLNRMGVMDYAGGGAVHALSGVAAFMGAAALGPRLEKKDDMSVEIPAHNASMMALGLFVLWFGFIPFNAGSGVSMLGWMAGQTGRIAVMTTMGGCSGGCCGVLYGLMPKKVGGVGYPSLEYAINGVLAGMVAVCGCCAVVPIWSVFWIISPIAVASYFMNQSINKKLKVDDPLGASSLHFGPGIVGVIMVGFFATDDLTGTAYGYTYGQDREDDWNEKANYIGVLMGGNGKQLGIQLAACVIYTVYGFVTCGLLFFGMKACKILRVPEEDEKKGLDITHHGGPAYDFGFGVTIEKAIA